VKFDFLGLKTLTTLNVAVTAQSRRRGIASTSLRMPIDDEPTYACYSRGDTVGVFQVEGATGMRKALVGMKPDRFEDIIALVALYRPGPMDNIPTYNARKHGEEDIDCLHPKL
jgi:DNA polymerase-3 subunit alpha